MSSGSWDRPPACPLAIVGIGCLFPKAPNARAYWLNVKHGVDAIGPIPDTHWKPEDYLDSDPKSPDRTYAARGGFLDAVEFRPLDFGIAPNDLEAIDTAQLLGLVAAREAMLDAGYGPERTFDRNRVSVVLGVTGTLELVIPLGARLGHPRWRKALKYAGIPDDAAEKIIRDIGDSYVGWQENSFPGLLGNVVAGRIANRLDLGGTNCVVDAACASSLSALHLAGLELAAGRSDMVITGGVDTFNDIFMYMCFSKTPALSPTGDAKPFDASGDGTILGEGLGMVVLKRLADAQRDGDRIYAIIKGLGSSSDGKGNAIYAPSAAGQMKALREAYRLADVTADTIELVEAHGTGTRVGDAVEVDALTQVYREARPEGAWCALGSVKSQIGHAKAAAGAAGLIKAALALHFKTLPSTGKVTEPIGALKDSPFYINSERRPWVANPNHPRRAAVSAFGFGGSNFHCVLEETGAAKTELDWDGEVEIAALSANDVAGLTRQLGDWARLTAWSEIQRTAAASRARFAIAAPVRLLMVLRRQSFDVQKLVEAIERKLRDEPALRNWKLPEGVYFGAGKRTGKLAVLFPGQGSQYPNMLRDLACLFPQMQDVVARANGHVSHLSDRIYPPFAFTREDREQQQQNLRQTDVAQPALGAVSLGAMRVLESFGIEPDACAGHSYGELTALCAAGWFDEEALHSLSKQRGQLMASYRDSDAGRMVAVHASAVTIAAVLAEDSLDVVIANRNAPNQTVLSGRSAEIERAIASLNRRQIRCTPLAVAAAFHSPLVASAHTPFREAIDAIDFASGSRPVYANTTGTAYPADAAAMRDLLAGQLAAPVNFVDEIRCMAANGVSTFLEAGPGSTLTRLVEAILSESSSAKDWAAFALDTSSGKEPGTVDLAHTLARLAAHGHQIDLTPWQRTGAPARAKPEERKSLIVPICGANYVSPKKKPTPAPSPAPIMKPASPARVATPPLPKANVQPAKPIMEKHVSSNGHHLHAPTTTASEPASPIARSQALEVTQQSLAAFQKLQEQTALLHKQFLENQEAAQRTLQMLLEQQQTVLLGGGNHVVASPARVALAKPRVEHDNHAPAPAVHSNGTNGSAHHRNGHHAPSRVTVPAAQPRIAPPVQQKPHAIAIDPTAILMAVVAEKTGYPPEMLAPEMSLDSDLGIDSIKRVEIFSALQEKLPNAPVVKPEHLGSLHTLGDVIGFLSRDLEPAAQARVSADSLACAAGSKASDILFEVIAEKTGYPTEMLAPEMALDADLGIDSIKRVEIFSALQERLPEAPVVKPEHLGSLHTLADVVAFLSESASVAAIPQKKTAESRQPCESLIERSALRAVPMKHASPERIQLAPGSLICLVGDSSPFCESLRKAIEKTGLSVSAHSWTDALQDGDYAGLLLVAPDPFQADLPLQGLRWMKRLRPRLQANAIFGTVTRLDGTFGVRGSVSIANPECGALAGLAKTANHEWPAVHCKALDVAGDFSLERASEIWNEILAKGPVEVGFTRTDRIELVLESSVPATSDKPPLDRSDVVLITGGARGVTAAAASAIAQRFQPTIVLLGRTNIDQAEPEALCDCASEASLKKALSQILKDATPRSIETEYRRIIGNREVHATVQALEHAGGRVKYCAADVSEPDEVAEALQRIRNEVGPVTCLIHGAGVLADRKIEDLSDDAFARVYATKVAGLNHLLRELSHDPLKAIVLFSSSTGRFGRTGQAAYAAANESLNKIAQQQAQARPDCKVASINWGPWDGGMVTPALRKLFADEGVGVIPLEEGGEILVRELDAPKADVEVTVIARPAVAAEPQPSKPVYSLEREVRLSDHSILRSHIIDGRAVLPLALHLEWLAHAALHSNPGLVFRGVNDLRLLHGVQFRAGESARVRIAAGKSRKEGSLFHVPVEIVGQRNGLDIIHSRGEVVLATRLPESSALREMPERSPAALDPATAYERYLFHGPDLQGIEAIHSIGADGIVVDCRTAAAPSNWMKQPLRNAWLADPLVLDCAFQAMIVWSASNHGAGCLPSFVGGYRQYCRTFPSGFVRIAVAITKHSGAIVRADIDMLDERGNLIARIENHESVIDDSLNRAFQHNRLIEEPALAEGGVR